MHVGSTVLGPSATQSQLLPGAVWMGKGDETREEWKAVSPPLAMRYLQAITGISVAVDRSQIVRVSGFQFRDMFLFQSMVPY